MVDVLLRALAVITGRQQAAGRVRGEARLQTSGLRVVVVPVAVVLGDVLQDDAPVALHIDGAADLGVVDLRRAQVALWTGPVAQVEWGRTLGSAGVVSVVERLLLVAGQVLDQIVSALVGHVAVLLEEDGIL